MEILLTIDVVMREKSERDDLDTIHLLITRVNVVVADTVTPTDMNLIMTEVGLIVITTALLSFKILTTGDVIIHEAIRIVPHTGPGGHQDSHRQVKMVGMGTKVGDVAFLLSHVNPQIHADVGNHMLVVDIMTNSSVDVKEVEHLCLLSLSMMSLTQNRLDLEILLCQEIHLRGSLICLDQIK